MAKKSAPTQNEIAEDKLDQVAGGALASNPALVQQSTVLTQSTLLKPGTSLPIAPKTTLLP